MLSGLGLKNTRLRRKMMDINAAKEGRENISTPREMMTLLEAIYRGKLLNPELTADFIKMLATHKDSAIRNAVPDAIGLRRQARANWRRVRTDSGMVFAPNRPSSFA